MREHLILNDTGLANRENWVSKGYCLPEYDRKEIREETSRNPRWVHFGPGNLFKALLANAVQTLLNNGQIDSGILSVERRDTPARRTQNDGHDHLCILVTLKSDGSVEKTVIGSIAETRYLYSGDSREQERLEEIFTADSLQVVSFTITEKGYRLRDAAGNLLPEIAADLEKGPETAGSYQGKVAALLLARFRSGAAPLAMVSMDNCSHNGDKLREAMMTFAEGWEKTGLAPTGFAAYVGDPHRISFPWTMIDKITPGPDDKIRSILAADGIGGMEISLSAEGTKSAPFVNAEESEYLVIEDTFPNGRPPFEKAGFYLTDRNTVNRAERMKVCTCLNPLHTALALFGCLLGFDRISEEVKDPDLALLIQRLGREEGLPVVENPGILLPEEFLRTVCEIRLPNPFLPDTPWRIATDTSQKLPIRFGETIKAYMKDPSKDVTSLKMIPLVFAAWLRCLMGIDDAGNLYTPSPDPMLEYATAFVRELRMPAASLPQCAQCEAPSVSSLEETLRPLLENEQIFGVNLVTTGMSPLVCRYFAGMLAGPGAVRQVLHQAVENS